MEVFNKILTKSEVEYRLHVPTASLEAFAIPEGAHKVNFDAVDITGLTWNFRLSTRRNDVHKKPVLSAGWLAYVRKKHLKKNDRVILHMNEEEANGVRFRIQAHRKIRLFGKDHWCNMKDN